MMKPNARGERFGLFHVPGLVISVDHQTSLTSSFGRFSDVLYALIRASSPGEYRLVGRRETGKRMNLDGVHGGRERQGQERVQAAATPD